MLLLCRSGLVAADGKAVASDALFGKTVDNTRTPTPDTPNLGMLLSILFPFSDLQIGIFFGFHPEIDAEINDAMANLLTAYQNASSLGFEVIFVPQSMPAPSQVPEENKPYLAMLKDYKAFRATLPFLSIRLENTDLASDFAEACDVNPEADRTLQMVQVSETGKLTVLRANAFGAIHRTGVTGFPWKKPLVQDLDEASEDDAQCLEGLPCCIVFANGEDGEISESLRAEVQQAAEVEQKEGRSENLHFFTTTFESEMASEYFLPLFGFEEEAKKKKNIFAVVDVPVFSRFTLPEEKKGASFAEFVAMYRKGELETTNIAPMEEDEEDEEDDEDDEEGDVSLGDEDTDEEDSA